MTMTKPKKKPTYRQIAREFNKGASMYDLWQKYSLTAYEIESMIRRAMKEGM